jgi:hypothetical protein
MVGLQIGMRFFLILTLALWCGDALAMLVSLCAPHFVIEIVVCAGEVKSGRWHAQLIVFGF